MTKSFWERVLISTCITLVCVNSVWGINENDSLEVMPSQSLPFFIEDNGQNTEDYVTLPSLKMPPILAGAMQSFRRGDPAKRNAIIDEIWSKRSSLPLIDSHLLHYLFPNFKEIKKFEKLRTQELGIIALLWAQEARPLTKGFMDEIISRIQQKDRLACYILGCLCLQRKGDQEDSCKGLPLLLQSVDQAYLYSHYIVGLMYLGELGVEKDEEIAFNYFKKSVSQYSSAYAHYMLGVMYWEGIGVKREQEAAVYWLLTAAKDGHVEAQEKLKEVLKLRSFDFDSSLPAFYPSLSKIGAVIHELQKLKKFYLSYGEKVNKKWMHKRVFIKTLILYR